MRKQNNNKKLALALVAMFPWIAVLYLSFLAVLQGYALGWVFALIAWFGIVYWISYELARY